ncbi:hypothetical protein GGR57DRAFT_508934 [Xylariaceae sp. FL1272]|nr:hypothetical protein GGR57DRAFT_508934 [Xylariaceae sp. FL1272]
MHVTQVQQCVPRAMLYRNINPPPDSFASSLERPLESVLEYKRAYLLYTTTFINHILPSLDLKIILLLMPNLFSRLLSWSGRSRRSRREDDRIQERAHQQSHSHNPVHGHTREIPIPPTTTHDDLLQALAQLRDHNSSLLRALESRWRAIEAENLNTSRHHPVFMELERRRGLDKKLNKAYDTAVGFSGPPGPADWVQIAQTAIATARGELHAFNRGFPGSSAN